MIKNILIALAILLFAINSIGFCVVLYKYKTLKELRANDQNELSAEQRRSQQLESEIYQLNKAYLGVRLEIEELKTQKPKLRTDEKIDSVIMRLDSRLGQLDGKWRSR